MRTLFTLSILFLLASCNNSVTNESDKVQGDAIKLQQAVVDSTTKSKASLAKLSVLVLPPFDEIANEGISPNIQKILERTFSNETGFTLIKFPSRQLMNVQYQHVFDKKYCSPITDKIKTDIIIMSKLDQVTRTGNMTTDTWNFKIKIYNIRTGSQKLSTLNTNSLTSSEIENLIKSRQQELFSETKNNR